MPVRSDSGELSADVPGTFTREERRSVPRRFAKTVHYPELTVGGFTHIDRSIAFYLQVNALLRPSFTVLDVGCGRGEYAEDPVAIRRDLRILKGRCAKVIGIDADPGASVNPCVDEFRPIETIGLALCQTAPWTSALPTTSWSTSRSRSVLSPSARA